MASASAGSTRKPACGPGEIAAISFHPASNFIQARQGLRDALAKDCPDIKVVAEEESAPTSSRWPPTPPPSSSAIPTSRASSASTRGGPRHRRAVTEAAKNGKLILTSNEAGRDYLHNIKSGTLKMVTMENYDTMDFFALIYLYTFHNDIIRIPGIDPWQQNWMPRSATGLILIEGQRGHDFRRDCLEISPAGSSNRSGLERGRSRALHYAGRLTMTRTLTPPAPVTLAEFDASSRVKNWGRWGPDDELGTMNYITPEKVARPRRIVRAGGRVSMAIPINKVAGPDNPQPAIHFVSGRTTCRSTERAVVRHVLPRHGQPRRLPHPRRRAQPHLLYGPALQRQAGVDC